MKRTSEVEQKLELLSKQLSENTKWKSVSEIPGLPFTTFEQFQKHIAQGSYSFFVDYTTANNMMEYTRSLGAYLTSVFSTCSPWIASIICIVLSIVLGKWLLLLGIVFSIAGFFLANPHIPFKSFFSIIGMATCILFFLLMVIKLYSLAILAGSFLYPFWVIRMLYSSNFLALRRAALNSETLFLYLYGEGLCAIFDNQNKKWYHL